MAKKALIGKNLLPNTNYDVIVSLDDGDPDTTKQVKRFSFKTPKFIPKLNAYYPESTVDQQITTAQTYSPKIEFPAYSVTTTHTFNVDTINVRYDNIGSVVRTPINSKITIVIKFKGEGSIDKRYIPTISGVGPTLSALFSNGKDITVNQKTITIKKTWKDLDPDLTNANRTKKGNDYGFWNSDIFKALYYFKKLYSHNNGAQQVTSLDNVWWNQIKNGTITYSNTDPVSARTIKEKTKTEFTVNSTINTKVPSSIIANTINDYNKGVVDYFYFFIKQNGEDNWWCFNDDIDSINPATISGQVIKGKYGSIDIKSNSFTPTYPKTIVTSSPGAWELTAADLRSRPITANAHVLVGDKQYDSDKKYDNSTFANKTFLIRFAIARYVKQDDGTWKGKWMPNLASTSGKHEVSEVLSAIESVSVG